jgi:hypothetical protein
VKQEAQPSSTNAPMVMWQSWWMREASWWAHVARRGSGERAGGNREVWEAGQVVLEEDGAGGARLLSR